MANLAEALRPFCTVHPSPERLEHAERRAVSIKKVGYAYLSSTDVREDASMLRTESVWSLINRKTDGLRILATRFRRRGMPTSRYDVWMLSLGPLQ